jgi:hypothetical protein
MSTTSSLSNPDIIAQANALAKSILAKQDAKPEPVRLINDVRALRMDQGLCISCGAVHENEPEALFGVCNWCSHHNVFGATYIKIMLKKSIPKT